jgi:hypothetical protein
MYEEEILETLPPEENPTKCYVCGDNAVATCERCKMPICDEHRQKKRLYVTRILTTLCDDCTDYYEAIIQPD